MAVVVCSTGWLPRLTRLPVTRRNQCHLAAAITGKRARANSQAKGLHYSIPNPIFLPIHASTPQMQGCEANHKRGQSIRPPTGAWGILVWMGQHPSSSHAMPRRTQLTHRPSMLGWPLTSFVTRHQVIQMARGPDNPLNHCPLPPRHDGMTPPWTYHVKLGTYLGLEQARALQISASLTGNSVPPPPPRPGS